ncbi:MULTISPECIES: protein-tyrosine phosphatase family protein [unclassified Roseivivax]|uniref:protein-tyrosine phosphatase family protein n=1 Tax=Roseivivax sp. GX 12232 TaxID=2900547 RepID=UPI001E423450|nr:protein-tyrosine phosphatase family protein [Roseivivax sp. GX 12232]MCE0507059.1 protein phosphatase [Roseivivax sp. GX 12232]
MHVIHALAVGSGILGIAPMPGASGDYAGDLEHLRHWRPALVLSLVTRLELYMAGAESFGADMQQRGTRWDQIEIEDGGAPDTAFDTRWVAVSGFARKALLGGGRVLVHCRAGCGRSGMAALRLMIEMGEAPDEALPRLRAVRPCAIETEAQMRWALAARPEPVPFLRHS